jgi:hypothetical protein
VLTLNTQLSSCFLNILESISITATSQPDYDYTLNDSMIINLNQFLVTSMVCTSYDVIYTV